MSASRNADANAGQDGQFGSHVPRSGPMTTTGHQPGKLVGNDAKPTFSAQTLPAGTAPADSTFQPNAVSETPGQADNELAGRQHGKENTATSAADTLGGASSADVHTGYGHPGQGMSSREAHTDGGADRRCGGLAGVVGGGSGQDFISGKGVPSGNQAIDEDTQPKARGTERESGDVAGTKDNAGANKGVSAGERLPESA